ncbi:MAG TPA: hypothetical protein VMN03_09140 [Burkholderiales bacterium]|nr:hypothetical protein [Burkholderiales bacterium]
MVRHRRQDWPLRLNAWLDSVREKAFAWGTHDCVLGAADAVLAMTGQDPAQAYRARYQTRTGAARVLAEHGGLEALVTGALGAPLPGPRLAGRGDVVLMESGTQGPMLAVVIGASAVAPGPEGATFLPMADWRTGWRV